MIDGRYRLVRLIGSGSLGTVYQCEDLHLQRQVAIKLLRPTSAEPLLLHLQREMARGGRIHHTNVCRLFSMGADGGIHFVVMEYVEGESLESVIRRGRLKEERALDILLQLCAALEEAHRQGIIHCDLKPENIIIDRRGQVKLTDFGLAVDLGQESEEVRAAPGTFPYRSPEQLLGGEITERCDVFALGVIAGELLGSRRMPRVRFGELDSVPRRYRQVIRRCLRLDPAERHASMSDFRQALLEAALSS